MEENKVRKQKRFFYTISEKLAIIDYYNRFDSSGVRLVSKNDIYKKYNIDHKSFNSWLKNEEEMRKCHDPKTKKTIHKGKQSNFTKEEEDIIINYVETSISNSVPLNYNIVARHIISLNLASLKGISDIAKYQRIVRLLKSNFYVIKKVTHIGQSIPDDADNKSLYFLKQVINYRKINEIDLSCIINPLYLKLIIY